MQHNLFALYAGPDQIMTVTSGLAGILGLLLMFWNKVVATFFKVVRVFRPSSEVPTPAASDTSTKTS